jgi:hypothetical protein
LSNCHLYFYIKYGRETFADRRIEIDRETKDYGGTTDVQTDKQTDRKTDRQTNRQTENYSKTESLTDSLTKTKDAQSV